MPDELETDATDAGDGTSLGCAIVAAVGLLTTLLATYGAYTLLVELWP